MQNSVDQMNSLQIYLWDFFLWIPTASMHLIVDDICKQKHTKYQLHFIISQSLYNILLARIARHGLQV